MLSLSGLLRCYHSFDKPLCYLMQQIRVLVTSGLLCTAFNFARGIKVICIELKKKRTSLQKKIYHPEKKSNRYGLCNWYCICKSLNWVRVGKPNYTQFHRRSMLFATVTLATRHKKQHLFQAFQHSAWLWVLTNVQKDFTKGIEQE